MSSHPSTTIFEQEIANTLLDNELMVFIQLVQFKVILTHISLRSTDENLTSLKTTRNALIFFRFKITFRRRRFKSRHFPAIKVTLTR